MTIYIGYPYFKLIGYLVFFVLHNFHRMDMLSYACERPLDRFAMEK